VGLCRGYLWRMKTQLSHLRVEYSLNKVSIAEKVKVVIRINPSNFMECEKKYQYDDENEVYNQ
jgi:hypothetical protein